MNDHKENSIIDNKYKLLDEIDKGGMGRVYKVKEIETANVYALKILDNNESNQYGVDENFAYGHGFKHENILEIIRTYNNKNGEPYIVSYILMRYIKDGYDLNKYLKDLIDTKKIDFSLDQALSIIKDIASGLEYLHEKEKYIHRDIKPSNILLDRGSFEDKKGSPIKKIFQRVSDKFSNDSKQVECNYCAIIGDLGVVRKIEDDGVAHNNHVIREDEYCPKELIKGASITHKVDIYGLGAIAFELLSQKKFQNYYSTDTEFEKKFGQEINRNLIKLIKQSIQETPEDRPDANQFIKCINQIQNEDTIVMKPEQKKTDQIMNPKKPKRANKFPEGIEFTTDMKYSFLVHDDNDNESRYFFTLNEDNKPIKLGDGTFGVIFCVHSTDKVTTGKDNQSTTQPNKKYAIKIFYKMNKNGDDDLDEEAQTRFAYESTFVSQVFAKLQAIKKDKYHSDSLLQNVAKTKDFMKKSKEDKNGKDSKQNETETKTDDPLEESTEDKNGKDSKQNETETKTDGPLEEYFSGLNLDLSSYAIVMDQYDYTLKELLESGIGTYTIRRSSAMKLLPKIPWALESLIGALSFDEQDIKNRIDTIEELKKDQKEKLKDLISECNGYDVLLNCDFKTRFKTILTFAFPIAEGLRALDYSENYHLDLKPANIFVKKSSQTIKTVIGDFGFLKPSTIKATSIATVHNLLPLGTRHYRSHEQRDYFDICDVEISSKNQSIISRDPKFQKSIIEAGDVLIFSKDIQKTLYTIKCINAFPDKKEIIIEEPCKILSIDDQGTQVIFFKQQRTRTDLFGFGAIIFDMLSGGKSPELFYDNIKPFDTEGNSIDDIMMHYDEVKNHIPTDHIYENAFEPFKNLNDNSYAPPDIVRVILKCMMYKVDGTYYKESQKTEGSTKPTDLLMTDFMNFGNETVYGYNIINNILYDLELKESNLHSEKTLKDSIDELNPVNIDTNRKPIEYVKRLAIGINYLQKLTDLIKNITLPQGDETTDDKHYLIQLTPDNLKWSKSHTSLDFGPSVYKDIKDYKNDLLENKAYSKFQRNMENSYIPRIVLHMHRNIELKKISNTEFEYKFLDGLISENIQNGDWIIGTNKLFKVECLDPNSKNIKLDDNILPEKAFGIFTYYHNIDPCRYYLETLSSYLYNIFFEGVDNNISQRPIITETYWHLALLYNNWNAISLIPDSKGKKSKEKRVNKFNMLITENQANHKNFKSLQIENKCFLIHICIVYLYIKLHFSLCNFSVYSQNRSDEDRINYVCNYVTNLRKMVEETFNFGVDKLENITKQGIENLFVNTKESDIKIKIPDTIPQTCFDDYIRMLVRIIKPEN